MTFDAFIRSLGIEPPRELQPGRWQRCATATHPRGKNGSVMLDPSGEFGLAQDWATMSECAVWTEKGDVKKERTAEQNSRLSEAIARKRQEEIKGTMRAATVYANAENLRHANHDYCRSKRIDMTGLRGVKVDNEGWLVVPMMRDGKLLSVQRISPTGEKKFQWGAPVKGATLTLHRPGATVTALAEGLSTGATVFSALQIANVIVCFNAGNLVEVAKRRDWQGSIVIAGDNDAQTQEIHGKNPGMEAAMEAAKAIGCGYAVPDSMEHTDFNDVYVARLSALEIAEKEKPFPAHPAKLKEQALAPIKMALLRATKRV